MKIKCKSFEDFKNFASEQIVDKHYYAYWFDPSLNVLVRLDINGNKLCGKFGDLGFRTESARNASENKGYSFC